MRPPSPSAAMATTSAPARAVQLGRRRATPRPAAQSTTTFRPPSGAAAAPAGRRGSARRRGRRPRSGRRRRRSGAPASRRGRARARARRRRAASSRPAPNSFRPLSGIALCDALTTRPRSAPAARAGVRDDRGRHDAEQQHVDAGAARSPAAAAASSIGPDGRVSRPMTARGRPVPPRSASSSCAALRATASASSGVRTSPLASPRTPSVPNSRARERDDQRDLQTCREAATRRVTASRRRRASACCTAAPCGPSSGRTSCAP